MNEAVAKIRKRIEPLRQEIIQHKVYQSIKNLDDLKLFMQYHVYAVWDFMSLLKTLQNNLTCTSVPWFPKGNADTRYLINEIVVGEESDIDLNGKRKSHFELYLDAMKQCGADYQSINTFIRTMQKSGDLNVAFKEARTPLAAKEFVSFTFDIIESSKPYLQSAIFTFGREDLIPSMFHSIVSDMHQKLPGSISIFKYYLDRHIEIDGDHHSHLALQMTSNLCEFKTEYWQEAEEVTVISLQKRIALWDGILEEINRKKAVAAN
jgi:hypothetical protein